MGDTSSQPPHSFHLLGLAELLLQFTTFTHVGEHRPRVSVFQCCHKQCTRYRGLLRRSHPPAECDTPSGEIQSALDMAI